MKLSQVAVLVFLAFTVSACGVPVSSQKHNADVTVHYLPLSYFDSPKGVYSDPFVYPYVNKSTGSNNTAKANLGTGSTKKNNVSNGGGTTVQ